MTSGWMAEQRRIVAELDAEAISAVFVILDLTISLIGRHAFGVFIG